LNLNKLLASLDRTVEAIDAPGISNRAQSTLRQVEAIPFAQIGQDARPAGGRAARYESRAAADGRQPAWTSISRDLQATAAQARKLAENPALPALLERVDQVTRRIDRLLASRDSELGTTVDNLLEISENLRQVSELLKRDPSAVLFSKPAPALQR